MSVSFEKVMLLVEKGRRGISLYGLVPAENPDFHNKETHATSHESLNLLSNLILNILKNLLLQTTNLDLRDT